MKVLVTGGSGFVGSHVVDRLIANGHEPRIFDLVPSPYHAKGIEFVGGDVVEEAVVRRAIRGCDAVVHLAAVSDVNKVLTDPSRAEAVNAGGTRVVLEAACTEDVPRVVYASTVWVYGSSNGHGPLGEDEPFALPGHLYTATKTISTGEGGILVSHNDDLVEYARSYRNYGKPSYETAGLNFRMSEFTAAIGLVQTERLDEIVAWKNEEARALLDPVNPGRMRLPEGMISGLYKYIVFDRVERSTGKVYDEPCHRLMRHPVDLPVSDWIAEHHWCVPLYYRPEEASA